MKLFRREKSRGLLLFVAIAVVAMCRPAAGEPLVTFWLSPNDDGFGGHAPNMFALYARASPDSGGLFSFNIGLIGNFTAPDDFLMNMLQGGRFEQSISPSQPEYTGMLANLLADSTTGRISGSQDLSRGNDLIPAYGLAQKDGNLNALKPPPPYQDFVDMNGRGSAYNAKLLVAVGHSSGFPRFDTTSSLNNVKVFDDRSGTETVNAALGVATNICLRPPAIVSLAPGTDPSNNIAVGGSIAVNGSNHNYVSEVDQLVGDPQSFGTAAISGIGDEPGMIYVMAKLSAEPSDIAIVLRETGAVDATDSQFAALHAAYDPLFDGGSFNALFKFQNFPGAKVLFWDLDAECGATIAGIDQLAVVPEPGMIGLIALAVAGLAVRKRR